MEYKDIEQVNSEIKYTQIKSKDYALVASRVQAFRKLFPEGFIFTDKTESGTVVIGYNEDGSEKLSRYVEIVATVGYYNMSGDKVVLATGRAEEIEGSSNINRAAFKENCETSAVGRALAFLGIGSTGDIASAEETVTAQGYDVISKEAAKNLRDTIKSVGKDEKYICRFHKVNSLEELTTRQYREVVKWLG